MSARPSSRRTKEGVPHPCCAAFSRNRVGGRRRQPSHSPALSPEVKGHGFHNSRKKKPGAPSPPLEMWASCVSATTHLEVSSRRKHRAAEGPAVAFLSLPRRGPRKDVLPRFPEPEIRTGRETNPASASRQRRNGRSRGLQPAESQVNKKGLQARAADTRNFWKPVLCHHPRVLEEHGFIACGKTRSFEGVWLRRTVTSAT